MTAGILVIDLGSTACKVAIFSVTGDILASATEGYPTWHPDDIRAEQHPDDWWTASSKSVRNVVSQGDFQISAIALTSQRETIVPVDIDGRPLHPAILWMDKRGVDRVYQLSNTVDGAMRRTGLVPRASYTAGKVHWFQTELPDVAKQTAYYLQPRDYLLHKMSGVFATDRTLASRSYLYNMRTSDWDDELLSELNLDRRKLPLVYESESVIGYLLKDVARSWGLMDGVPIVLGGGDRPCEILGSGVSVGEAMEATGTTSNVACVVDSLDRFTSERVSISAHVVSGLWVLEQGMSTSGGAMSWLHSLFGDQADLYDLDRILEKTTAGASGIMALPFFMGARAPRWNPNAQGALLGLTLGHASSDIYRSVFEGIGYELRYAIEIYESMGLPIHRIRLIGGGAYIERFNQMKSSMYRKNLARPKIVQAAAFGAFLLAARTIGWIDSYEEGQRMNPLTSIYHPDIRDCVIYDEGYALYLDLCREFESIWKKLHNYRYMGYREYL